MLVRHEPLKPCPICGNSDLETDWHGNYHAIRCERCGISMSTFDEPYADRLHETWNDRQSLDLKTEEMK